MDCSDQMPDGMSYQAVERKCASRCTSNSILFVISVYSLLGLLHIYLSTEVTPWVNPLTLMSSIP